MVTGDPVREVTRDAPSVDARVLKFESLQLSSASASTLLLKLEVRAQLFARKTTEEANSNYGNYISSRPEMYRK